MYGGARDGLHVHPQASRIARRTERPVIVFNLHEQFVELRTQGNSTVYATRSRRATRPCKARSTRWPPTSANGPRWRSTPVVRSVATGLARSPRTQRFARDVSHRRRSGGAHCRARLGIALRVCHRGGQAPAGPETDARANGWGLPWMWPGTTERDCTRRWPMSARCSSSKTGLRLRPSKPIRDSDMGYGFQGQAQLRRWRSHRPSNAESLEMPSREGSAKRPRKVSSAQGLRE